MATSRRGTVFAAACNGLQSILEALMIKSNISSQYVCIHNIKLCLGNTHVQRIVKYKSALVCYQCMGVPILIYNRPMTET